MKTARSFSFWRRGHQPREAWAAQPIARGTNGPASISVLCALGISVAAFAAPDWENEQVLSINREPARATFLPFATVEQARLGDATASPFVLSLSSETAWKFHWVPRPEERP